MKTKSALVRLDWIQLVWAVNLPLLTMICLWNEEGREKFSLLMLPIIGFMFAIHFYYGETPKWIGFWPADFKSCFLKYSKVIAAIAVLLVCGGLTLGTLRNAKVADTMIFFAKYCFFGLVQQYALNGFFVNRLVAFYGSDRWRGIPVIAAAVFAVLHFPNWFLVGVTFVTGYICATVFLKYRNLYFLGFAHGLFGVLLFFAFPTSVTHHFVTGIKYFYN